VRGIAHGHAKVPDRHASIAAPEMQEALAVPNFLARAMTGSRFRHEGSRTSTEERIRRRFSPKNR
jgi:hypothetical protein